jgi:hypothetical protein
VKLFFEFLSLSESSERVLANLVERVAADVKEESEERKEEAADTVIPKPLVDEKGDFIYSEVISRDCRKLLNK